LFGRSRCNGVGLCALACATSLVVCSVAAAKTYRPNTTSDHAPNGCSKSDCTLREAITAANGHGGLDSVVVRGGKTYELAIPGRNDDTNAQGDLDVSDSLKLSSSNAKLATIDAKGLDRVLDTSAPKATFIGLRFRGGNPGGGSGGGGFTTRGGKVKLVNCEISGNRANHAAGLETSGGTGTNLKVIGTTITGNHASDGTGGVGIFDTNKATFTNVTITKNTATGDAGGMEVGGIVNLNGVTIARNKADSDADGAGRGGGIDALDSGIYHVKNSLIALNTIGSPSPPNAVGPNCHADNLSGIVSGGHNLLGTVSACGGVFNATGDRMNRTAGQVKIGKLADNGGPTKTIALKSGSQAIDHAAASAPAKDQRGHRRGAKPDIGAYERD